MKVLQVTNAESPFFQTQLDALTSAGVEYTVTAPATGSDGDRAPMDYVRWMPAVRRQGGNGFDVVHANYGLTGPVALAQSTRPFVLSLWGSDVMGESRVVDRVSRFAADRADAVIAPSRALQSALDTDSTLVPFGVDMDRFRPMDRAAAREELGWPQDEDVALFPYDPAREVKNYPLAADVVDRVTDDVTLRTVSGVDYERMPTYFNASDLVLVTSEREAGPMVVKEAAACNVPVVSTDVGFVRNALDDVENAYVDETTTELAAGVERVLATDDRRSSGRDSADVISIEEMGARLRAVYDDVTN